MGFNDEINLCFGARNFWGKKTKHIPMHSSVFIVQSDVSPPKNYYSVSHACFSLYLFQL